uniref:Serpentine receptor class r-10 n=1 Tax=Caenorhabditis japonica TaxID=281687 RepID=A0A8R1HZA6_CAEJA
MLTSLVFYPSLGYNLIRNYVQPNRWAWYNRVDDTLIIGAMPFKSMKDELVQKENVGGVVCCTEEFELKAAYKSMQKEDWKEEGVEFFAVPMKDFTGSAPRPQIHEAVQFMENVAAKGKTVYVHCKPIMHTNTKNFIQMCCLPFALLTNLSLFILILTRSPPKLGNYKYLMAFFSFVSSGFSALGALVNPHLISTADCFVVASKVQFEDAQVDRVILYYGCAACGIIMSMFVVHFIYRFFAVQRRGNLKYFEKWWFPCWIAVPLITGFVWAQINFIFMHEDKETSDYIREIVENQYSTDMNHIVYNGMTYYHKNWELNWNGLYGVIILGSIMTICFVLILYFGTLTYYRIKHLIIYGMSEFTKRLQKQLYYALVLQLIMKSNTKNFIQMCCLPFALLTNLSLFILILTRSPPKLGNYKYLMAFFSFVSSGFSTLGALVNPHLISTVDCFVVATKVKLVDTQVDRVILYYSCGSCGIVMSMFVVHFIYRFFAVERRGNLKYFEKWWFPCWVAVPVVTGFVWAQTIFIFTHEDEETSEYIRETVKNLLSVDMNNVVYAGMIYYHKNSDLNWNGVYGVAILGSTMTICLLLILYYGTLTYYRIKLLILHGMSEFTKRLQKQLYYALVLQTETSYAHREATLGPVPSEVLDQVSPRGYPVASGRTIRQRLNDALLFGKRPVKMPYISDRNRAARVAWARAHLNWTQSQWERFCRVMRASSCYLVQMEFHISHGLGPLHRIRGNMDRFVYEQILQNVMLPFARASLWVRYSFQQDNDPKHTSNHIKLIMQTSTKNFIQMCCLPFALLTNISLFILILTRSPPKLGNYKYLMAFFSFVSTGFSAVGALVNPHLISTADCFVVAAKVQFEDAQVDRMILCESVPNNMHADTTKFLQVCCLPFALLTNLSLICLILTRSPKKLGSYKYLMVFFSFASSGYSIQEAFINPHLISTSDCFLAAAKVQFGDADIICLLLILYFGTLTYYRIKLLILHGMSEFTKRLQKQLYYALVLQTIIPIFFLILPLTFFFFLPFFNLGSQLAADVATLCIAIYPIIDPLPVIFVIDNYRSAIFELFGVKPEQQQNVVNFQTTSSILLANAMIGFERINDCEEDYGIIEDEEVAENSPIDSDLGPNYEMGDLNNVEEDDMEFEEFGSSLPGPSFSFGAGDSNDATPNKILRSQQRISKRVVKSDISAPATRRRRVNKEN